MPGQNPNTGEIFSNLPRHFLDLEGLPDLEEGLPDLDKGLPEQSSIAGESRDSIFASAPSSASNEFWRPLLMTMIRGNESIHAIHDVVLQNLPTQSSLPKSLVDLDSSSKNQPTSPLERSSSNAGKRRFSISPSSGSPGLIENPAKIVARDPVELKDEGNAKEVPAQELKGRPGNTIKIKKLPRAGYAPETLMNLCLQFGSMTSFCYYLERKSGQSRTAFVVYCDEVAAQKAVENLNGKVIDGRALTAKFHNQDNFGRL